MNIVVTKRAELNYKSIKKYITKEFGEKASDEFDLKTIKFLDLLANFPLIGSMEVPAKNIRGFQFTKQTRLMYRLKSETIIVLNFFHVRQSPAKKL
jgi:plasmid stabilization system protein ParE